MPKCVYCKQPATMRIGLRNVCGFDCATEYGIEKARKKAAIEQRRALLNEKADHRAAKEKVKTLKRLCAEARVVVQKYARLRDQKYGVCICCGTGPIEHGCHYFAIGSKYQCARLSLDDRQIHGGCIKCNKYVGGGNRPGYDAGILSRYGQGYLDMLNELKRKADHGEDAPLSKDEVRQIKAEYQAKNRELEKSL